MSPPLLEVIMTYTGVSEVGAGGGMEMEARRVSGGAGVRRIGAFMWLVMSVAAATRAAGGRDVY